MPEISIIIPAYNEEMRIKKTLNEFINFFSSKYGNNYEILVMTDGCTDNTVFIVQEICKSHPQVFNYNYNGGRKGKGGGIIEGFRHASGDVIICADADVSVSVESLHKLINSLDDNDGVIASRYIRGAKIDIKQPISRRIASRAFNIIVRFLLGLPFRDTQCSGKVFRRHAIERIIDSISTLNFAFDIDLLYQLRKHGFKIREVPVAWKDENGGTVRLSTPLTMFFAVIRLRIVNSPFRPIVNNRVVSRIYNYGWMRT